MKCSRIAHYRGHDRHGEPRTKMIPLPAGVSAQNTIKHEGVRLELQKIEIVADDTEDHVVTGIDRLLHEARAHERRCRVMFERRMLRPKMPAVCS